MHNFFHLVSPIGQGILRQPEWAYIRDGLKRNLGTVISYYRNNPKAVRSDHFLVRILQSIAVPQSQNLERYYDNVDGLALNMSMALKMTSSIYQGSIFKGVFYGPGNDEILIANNDDFNPLEAHRNWQNLVPVKVLRHPRSDLGLNLPDGHDTGSETGLVVVSINIPMLAVQYRAFRFNEIMLKEGTQETQKSAMQFIHMYVLPNMLYSHLDYALFNRIDNWRKGAPIGESEHPHPFFLPDYSDKVNQVQLELLHKLQLVGKDFTGILRTIPAVTANDMEEAMLLPQAAPTRQILWALAISRLPMLTFLFKVLEAGPGMRNQSEVNRVLRSVVSYKSNNLMRSLLPIDIYFEVEDEIEQIVQSA